MELVTELMCIFCGVILDEDDVCMTKAGPSCDSCADRIYPIDHGDSVYPH